MVNIYIDDSGTSNLLQKDQPVFLFSAVLIDNGIASKVTSLIDLISKEMDSNLNQILTKAIASDEYDSNRVKDITGLIQKKLTGGKLEIHCSKLVRGDDVYMIFERVDRIKYVEDTLKVIDKNDIQIITAYCTKSDYENKYDKITAKERQQKANEDVVKILLENISAYLEREDKEACVIVDKGNDTLKKVLIPKIKSGEISKISTEVLEKDSGESCLIQLADACAYTSYLYYSSQYKQRNKLKDKNGTLGQDLYSIISKSAISIDIAEEIVIENDKKAI